MPKIAFQHTIAKSPNGDVVPNANVQINIQGGGAASLFTDRAGTPFGGSLTTDPNGYFSTFLTEGLYEITITATGYNKTFSNVVVSQRSVDSLSDAPSKTTPIAADQFSIIDSVTGLLARLTLTNLVTYLSAPPVTAGTSSAYTVGLTLVTNNVYKIRFDQANAGGAVTLNGTPIKLRDNTSNPLTGQISAGVHNLHFNGTNALLLDSINISYAGSFTTASLAVGTTEDKTLTHGLGTDNVNIEIVAFGSGTIGTSGNKWHVSWGRPDKGSGFYTGINSSNPVISIGTAPASGDVLLRVHNPTGSATQTITVFYKITSLN